MSDQSTWPAHMRDDAPTATCNRCQRRTVAPSEFGRTCDMSQPDGSRCIGRFSNPADKMLLPESVSFPSAVWIVMPRGDREQEFLRGLTDLLNRTSMDAQTGAPDYILAELVLGHLRAFREARIAQARHEGRVIQEVDA